MESVYSKEERNLRTNREIPGWLDREPSASAIPAWIFLGCLALLLYGELVTMLLQYFHLVDAVEYGWEGEKFGLRFAVDHLQIAGGEEMVFRAPLTIPLLLFRRAKVPLLLTAAVSSGAFAMYHEGNLFSFATHGIIGLALCVIFMKCGGMNGKLFKALWVTTAIHFLHNMVLALLSWW